MYHNRPAGGTLFVARRRREGRCMDALTPEMVWRALRLLLS